MNASCPACGPVSPQESSGTAALRCPHCGHELIAAPASYSTAYGAAAPDAPGYGAVYPASEGYAPYPEFEAPLIVRSTRPADLAMQYDSWIMARRWLSTIVDHVTLMAFVFLPLVAAHAALGQSLFEKTILIWIVPGLIYFPLLEGKLGVTPGKWLAGVRVVDAEGRVPGLWKATIRTLLRLVEVNPVLLGGIIAGVVVLASRSRQRLGDHLAGTYVLTAADARTAREALHPPTW